MPNRKQKAEPKRSRVSISMTISDAETMLGFIDGGVGTSDDASFTRWGKKMIKKLLISIEKHNLRT